MALGKSTVYSTSTVFCSNSTNISTVFHGLFWGVGVENHSLTGSTLFLKDVL